MADLLAAATSDTTGTAAEVTDPSTVQLTNNSTLADGAYVAIEWSKTNVSNTFGPTGATLRHPGVGVSIDIAGTYYLRAKLVNAGTGTSVTVVV